MLGMKGVGVRGKLCGDEGSVGVKIWWMTHKYLFTSTCLSTQSHCSTVVSILGILLCSCRLVLLGFDA